MVERRNRRRWRTAVAEELAAERDGVVHREALRHHGISRDDVRTEVEAGRWQRRGRHTVRVLAVPPGPNADLWRAVWESGSGAALDGAAALVAVGMTGYRLAEIDVTLPEGRRAHTVDGTPRVRRHRVRGSLITASVGLPRVLPAPATIHAAQWARSDRQAALLVCLPVQQRLLRPADLLQTWSEITRSPRRQALQGIVSDVADGAHSLGELDFARLCRAYGLPEPTRQQVCRAKDGRVYLDVFWQRTGLVVEIDGGHHFWALTPIEDCLRQNELTIGGDAVLRIPVLGLRLAEREFMSQVRRAYDRLLDRPRRAG